MCGDDVVCVCERERERVCVSTSFFVYLPSRVLKRQTEEGEIERLLECVREIESVVWRPQSFDVYSLLVYQKNEQKIERERERESRFC